MAAPRFHCSPLTAKSSSSGVALATIVSSRARNRKISDLLDARATDTRLTLGDTIPTSCDSAHIKRRPLHEVDCVHNDDAVGDRAWHGAERAGAGTVHGREAGDFRVGAHRSPPFRWCATLGRSEGALHGASAPIAWRSAAPWRSISPIARYSINCATVIGCPPSMRVATRSSW